jgi:hypothetical protein
MQALIHIWAFPRMIVLFLWWNRLRFLLNETKFLSALVMSRLLDWCHVGRRDTWEVLLRPRVILRVGVQTRDLGNETVPIWGTLWGFQGDWGCVFSYHRLGWSWRCALSDWGLLASLYSLHIDELEIFRWGYWSLLPFSVRRNIVLDETINCSDWALIFL